MGNFAGAGSGARASGIYALVNLDGTPLDPADLQHLGVAGPPSPASWAVDAVDTHAPQAVHRHDDARGATVLVGEVEDAGELAARLGLQGSAPIAQIARAALERFGSETPAEMVGEWSLLQRDHSGTLTLMVSAGRRDRLLYAVAGSKIAIAPNLFVLCRIGWIGNALDEAGLLFALGQSNVRAGTGDRTMLTGVRQLEPAQSVVISRDGQCRRAVARVLAEPPRWSGSFGDVVAESDDLLRRIMRDRLARAGRVAPLLSGGLDSSLLTWLAAAEQGQAEAPVCITSVAPSGSGIPDEAKFADEVAAHLDLACRHVAPPEAANTYRPAPQIFVGANGPPLSNRHCLTDAFHQEALQAGAKLLINGCFGEMSVTARLPEQTLRGRLRAFAAQAYHSLPRIGASEARPSGFHVRLARHRLADLPEPVRFAASQPIPPFKMPGKHDLFGFLPGTEKMLGQTNEFHPGALRMDYPFRDLRLLRLFAGIPVATLLQGGADRAVARQLLEGQLPDAIRLRRTGMPASPDHNARLRRQAPAARARIAQFRKADVDDWLDLDWLDQALGRVGEHGAANVAEANEVQLTAIAAEFLVWWRTSA